MEELKTKCEELITDIDGAIADCKAKTNTEPHALDMYHKLVATRKALCGVIGFINTFFAG